MKKAVSLLAMAAISALPATASTVDSVYIKPATDAGAGNLQIAYSYDKVVWKKSDCRVFRSEFGQWGVERKIYYPVIDYDGKHFRVTFFPNPAIAQMASTESDDFIKWTPQDYPYVDKAQLERLVAQQKAASENNIVRIPTSILREIYDKQLRDERIAANDAYNYVAAAEPLRQLENITATLTVRPADRKAISPDLIGIFFEDISYAADGGLYAELIQNRDFEYSADDHHGWHSLTAWALEGAGTTASVSTEQPQLNKNNPHYVVLTTTAVGGCLANEGWDGIPMKKGEKYLLTIFVKGKGKVRISVLDGDKTIASSIISATSGWQKQQRTLTAVASAEKARLTIEPLQVGTLALDYVSLFPKDTYKGRVNGLRRDLAETIADLHPRFMRFPGGCMTHGQGMDNIYHWQASVGEPWERQGDLNIWGYHQTRGLGFYEYFQFCEDIGAEPLPVLAAGVPCQNSWRGGLGQQGGLPFERELNGKPSPYTYNGKPLTMESYLQELLDLIEWANGDPKTSKLAAMRAKAGHPTPFNLKYLGIGNEDLITKVFRDRYIFLAEGVRAAHPEISIVGTVGYTWEGPDYECGWDIANANHIPIVDEHYYNQPGWFFNNRDYYDNYSRTGTKAYLGEWASWGNNVSNALVEAAYMANLERNGDVVKMSSYAPLLAKEGHVSWAPNLLFFNNSKIRKTANYFVQRAFGQNGGDTYIHSDLQTAFANPSNIEGAEKEVGRRIDHSVVTDSKTGDVIIKLVSTLPVDTKMTINIGEELLTANKTGKASVSVLAQGENGASPDSTGDWAVNTTSTIDTAPQFDVVLPAWSLTTIRISK